jgi:hypothetical protein
MTVKKKSDDSMGAKQEFKTGIKPNKPFHDPIGVLEKTNGREEWSFKAPSYDNRTSGSIPAGDYYGVGFNQPIGVEKARPMSQGPIPQTSKAFSPNEIFGEEDRKG